MSSRSGLTHALVLAAVAAALVRGQQTVNPPNDLNRISSTVLRGQSMELLRELTDDIGARLVGSPAYDRAAQWAATRLREAGLTNIRFEEFTLPDTWQRGSARARLIAPVERALRIGSVGWGPSTPPGGIRGDVILVSDLSAATIRSQSAQLKHRIVLVDLEKALPSDQPLAFARLRNAYALLKDLGAQAVLLPHRVANNVAGWVDTGNARGTVLPLPVGDIGLEDNLLLRRHLARGPVTIEAEWRNEVSGPTQVSNLVAEITGRELPHEWVLLGAHLDSWDLGTGAQDNGTGVVMVLEAARAIASLDKPPRRSIRFALWAAEEPGPPGSAMFIKRHANDLQNCIAVLNTDNGAGRPRGWYVNGRNDLRAAMRPISARLRDLRADGLSMDASCGSDECPFLLEGIPALKLWVDTTQYRQVHHQASDTFDKVDATSFRAGGAVVAMTTYTIANQPSRLAPHIGQDTVRQILRTAKLDVELMYSLWKP
ncbi:MAG TPA: M20/M25/M40 family metallo-hydrolase [Vicinamibacterales bacterium]|nr:M20/M25/M40 family metallo-hydrolase [Vicinamibacterales bacterium]